MGVGARLAVWQTHFSGLRWLDELVKAKKVIDLGGGGYPDRWTAKAEILFPFIREEPPEAHTTWMREDSDVVLDFWAGKTEIDREAIDQCRFGEWLVIEAWDES